MPINELSEVVETDRASEVRMAQQDAHAEFVRQCNAWPPPTPEEARSYFYQNNKKAPKR